MTVGVNQLMTHAHSKISNVSIATAAEPIVTLTYCPKVKDRQRTSSVFSEYILYRRLRPYFVLSNIDDECFDKLVISHESPTVTSTCPILAKFSLSVCICLCVNGGLLGRLQHASTVGVTQRSLAYSAAALLSPLIDHRMYHCKHPDRQCLSYLLTRRVHCFVALSRCCRICRTTMTVKSTNSSEGSTHQTQRAPAKSDTINDCSSNELVCVHVYRQTDALTRL